MSLTIIVRCDTCRDHGLEVGFDRADETLRDIIAALEGAGWEIHGLPAADLELASLRYVCPVCLARDPMKLRRLSDLRRRVEAAYSTAATAEPSRIRAEAIAAADRCVRIVEDAVAIPRTFVHRRPDGQLVPVDALAEVVRFIKPRPGDELAVLDGPGDTLRIVYR